MGVNVYFFSSTTASASPSNWSHFGGGVAGLLIGILFGRNIVKKEWEKHVWNVSLGVSLFLIVFSFGWIMSWAPANIHDGVRWCWARQVYNMKIFGDDQYHCVRCATDSCIRRWSAELFTERVAAR